MISDGLRYLEGIAFSPLAKAIFVFLFIPAVAYAQGVDCQALYDEAKRTNENVGRMGYEALSGATEKALDCYGASFNENVGWLMDAYLYSQNQRKRYGQALTAARSYREIILAENDSLSLARLYQRQGVAHFYLGHMDSMYWSYQHALALSKVLSDQRRLSIYTNIVYFYKKAELSSRAFSLAEAYEPVFREAVSSDSALMPRLYIFLTTASEAASQQFEKSGQAHLLERAQSMAAEAARLARQHGDEYRLAFALIAQAWAARLSADYVYADFLLVTTEEIQARLNNVRLGSELLRQKGLLLVAMEQTDEGREWLVEALSLAEQGDQEDLARSALDDLQALYNRHDERLADDLARGLDFTGGFLLLALALVASLVGLAGVRYRHFAPYLLLLVRRRQARLAPDRYRYAHALLTRPHAVAAWVSDDTTVSALFAGPLPSLNRLFDYVAEVEASWHGTPRVGRGAVRASLEGYFDEMDWDWPSTIEAWTEHVRRHPPI